MVELEEDDSFTVCSPSQKNMEYVLLGTKKGRFFRGRLNNIEVDKFDGIMKSVLDKNIELLNSFKSYVRDIRPYDGENLIIVTERGGIFLFNENNNTFTTVNVETYSVNDKIWRVLILEDYIFLVSKTYGNYDMWLESPDGFRLLESYHSGSDAIFFLEWFDRSKNLILTNNFSGRSILWFYKSEENGIELNAISEFGLDPNLQKSTTIDKKYIIAVDYHGGIFVYSIVDEADNLILKKIDQYELSASQGNWVHYSSKLNMVLIGTDDILVLLDRTLRNVYSMNIACKQMFSVKDLDFILTPKTIVKPDFSKKKVPKDVIRYQYIKIGLVGDSRVGKTCFCKFLQTREFFDTNSSYGKHVWSINLDELSLDSVQYGVKSANRRILFFDPAGQRSELFTYLPLIQDSQVILIFYRGNQSKEEFDQAITYYDDLGPLCPNAQFYFIQTFADDEQRTRETYITKKLEERKLDINTYRVKVSPKIKTGFEEFREKILEKFDWESAPAISKSKIYDEIEKIMNDLYNKGVECIQLADLSKKLSISKQTAKDFIVKYYEQGMIEYIDEIEEIVINCERYEKLHTDIAELVAESDGIKSTREIVAECAQDAHEEYYVKNILKYYQDHHVSITYKQPSSKEELVVFYDKIKDHITKTPHFEGEERRIEYKDNQIDHEPFLLHLNGLGFDLIEIAKNEIFLQKADTKSKFIIRYNILTDSSQYPNYIITIRYERRKEADITAYQKIEEYLLNVLGSHIIIEQPPNVEFPTKPPEPSLKKKTGKSAQESPLDDTSIMLEIRTFEKRLRAFVKKITNEKLGPKWWNVDKDKLNVSINEGQILSKLRDDVKGNFEANKAKSDKFMEPCSEDLYDHLEFSQYKDLIFALWTSKTGKPWFSAFFPEKSWIETHLDYLVLQRNAILGHDRAKFNELSIEKIKVYISDFTRRIEQVESK